MVSKVAGQTLKNMGLTSERRVDMWDHTVFFRKSLEIRKILERWEHGAVGT